MDRKDLMAQFNKRPRIGTISTANRQGDVNVAVVGSPQMIDEETVVMGLADNRTFSYLSENPKAVFIFMDPGPTPPEWQGARVYLEATVIATEGEELAQRKAAVAAAGNQRAADSLHAAVRFRITEVRTILAPK
jgi:hypothetical protein